MYNTKGPARPQIQICSWISQIFYRKSASFGLIEVFGKVGGGGHIAKSIQNIFPSTLTILMAPQPTTDENIYPLICGWGKLSDVWRLFCIIYLFLRNNGLNWSTHLQKMVIDIIFGQLIAFSEMFGFHVCIKSWSLVLCRSTSKNTRKSKMAPNKIFV